MVESSVIIWQWLPAKLQLVMLVAKSVLLSTSMRRKEDREIFGGKFVVKHCWSISNAINSQKWLHFSRLFRHLSSSRLPSRPELLDHHPLVVDCVGVFEQPHHVCLVGLLLESRDSIAKERPSSYQAGWRSSSDNQAYTSKKKSEMFFRLLIFLFLPRDQSCREDVLISEANAQPHPSTCRGPVASSSPHDSRHHEEDHRPGVKP